MGDKYVSLGVLNVLTVFSMIFVLVHLIFDTLKGDSI